MKPPPLVYNFLLFGYFGYQLIPALLLL